MHFLIATLTTSFTGNQAIVVQHFSSKEFRDIKPENIIYNPTSKEIKLIDFGFSGGVQSPQVDLTFCGSVEYASPEILSKLSFLGLEVDVWSSGIHFYNRVMCTNIFFCCRLQPSVSFVVECFTSQLLFSFSLDIY